jgi:hypothetical protein
VWDGTSNLIVEICFDNTTYTGTVSDAAVFTAAGYNAVCYKRMDGGVGCTMTGGTTSANRINTRFNACNTAPLASYSWAPAASIASGATTLTPTTTNLTSNTTYIVTATSGSCIMKDTVQVVIAAPSSLTWTGTTNTDWFTRTNWNQNCLPECATTVTIPSSVTNMPLVNALASANSITINSAASLTLGASATVSVCGNFTNNGTFTASPTSTVQFNNAAITQNIDGNLTGANKFGNLLVSKTGGAVNLLQNIEVAGNLTTMNSTSVINTNGKYVTVGGNFNNSSGSTTYTI